MRAREFVKHNNARQSPGTLCTSRIMIDATVAEYLGRRDKYLFITTVILRFITSRVRGIDLFID